NGIRIFCSVQAVDWRSTRIWRNGCCPVEFPFQPRRELIVGGFIATRQARRRHAAAVEFPYDFFPNLCLCCNMTKVGHLERQSRGSQPIVIAAEAVLGKCRTYFRLDGRRGRLSRRCGVVKVASKTEDDNRTEKCHPLQRRRSVNVSDNTPASHRCSLSSSSGSGVRCLIRQCKHKNGVSGRRKGTVRHQVCWNLE